VSAKTGSPTPQVSDEDRGKMAERSLDPTIKAWMRQPHESWQAYEAFTNFLMLGNDRTYTATADAIGKSFSLVAKWGAQWHWMMRAAMYEEHYMLLRLESIEAKRDQMYVRHESLANVALSLVEGHFDTLLAALEKAKEDGKKELAMKPDALVRLFDIAVKVNRLAVIGRTEDLADAAERTERLAEAQSDELARIMKDFMASIDLTPDQQERAKEALSRVMTEAPA
jgi:hypothetical protein